MYDYGKKDIDMNILSERLAAIRTKDGLTQAEAARFVGANATSWCEWEAKHRTPPVSVVVAIAYCFNTSVEYLIGKSDDPSPIDNELRFKDLPDEDAEAVEDFLSLNDRDREFIRAGIKFLKNRR